MGKEPPNGSERLYRTYEGLKLLRGANLCVMLHGLYRTYEGLKRELIESLVEFQKGLYRTYEELKHPSHTNFDVMAGLFLSYL